MRNTCIYGVDIDYIREKIAVYPEYIKYNIQSGPGRKDYIKYEYKVKGTRLFVKAFEYGRFYEETAETRFEYVKEIMEWQEFKHIHIRGRKQVREYIIEKIEHKDFD